MARILVVDDDPDFCAAATRMLESMGHEVELADNGNTAVSRFRASPADIVLMDMFMPDVDGWETTLRFSKEFNGVRIVGMSGGAYLDTSTVLDIARRLGAFRTLAKPFSSSELKQTIDAVMTASAEVEQ